MKNLFLTVGIALGLVQIISAQAVVPGWNTDPTAVKEALGKDDGYKTPEAFRYPYISTYYVKPNVTPDVDVKVGIFVTDFEHSKIRFLDDSHTFTAYLEYRKKGGVSKVLTLQNLKSGDAEFNLGKLPVGEYEMRVWAKDAKGRESHRVIHDFRVLSVTDFAIIAQRLAMPKPDATTNFAIDNEMANDATLKSYGIRKDGDLEKVVYVGVDGKQQVVKEKREGVPGYTVTVPLDPKTGKPPYRAFEKAKVVYDNGYDKAAVEAAAVETSKGIQKLIDDWAAQGMHRLALPDGTYRVSHTMTINIPDNFTLDLGNATIKLNQFTGEHCTMVRMASAVDAHVVNGTIEGDYWAHDYQNSPKDSEWVNGFQISGDSWYCSYEGVTVREVAGYGGSNYIEKDDRGSLAFFAERLPKFAPGGLNPKTGEVDVTDKFRFTTDFKDLKKITGELGRHRLQISKYLGYQGVKTRSWQMTVAWYDAQKKFISSETAWQYREMWIPEKAAFIRVSVEDKSLEDVNPALYTEELQLIAIRYPINCAIKNCRFERCRCVGYAAAQMKNWLFEGNYFTTSGEAEAKCAFDAEDGADQMQDVYFLKNTFRDNPVNNSILTCAGHNFILERNDGGIHFWGRTHSPCVRDNNIEQATLYCDSRVRSGYARIEDNHYSKGIKLGVNDWKKRPDNWDFVLSGRTFDGAKEKFSIDVGNAGRVVGCTFRNIDAVGIANAYACTFENCKGWFSGTKWTEVTLKDSTFKNFYNTNTWTRCHIENSTIEGVNRTTFNVNKCDFTSTKIIGLNGTTVNMDSCSFKTTDIDGGWWASPANILFKCCTIDTGEKASFLQIAVYNIGKVGFDGCTVTGKKSLVHVKDLRPLKYFQGECPDLQTGVIALNDTKWNCEAKTVVTHGTGKGEPLSTKKLTINGKANTWPADVVVATDLFPTWELK